MTLSDIKRIEQTLEISLPLKLIEKYLSDEIAELDKYPELSGYLINDLDKLIKINLRVRTRGLYKKTFSSNLFVIGYLYKTDYYFINLLDLEVIVYFANRSKTWGYNPDNLLNNILITGGDIDTYLELYPLCYLAMNKEQEVRDGLGLQEEDEEELSAEEIYRFLKEL